MHPKISQLRPSFPWWIPIWSNSDPTLPRDFYFSSWKLGNLFDFPSDIPNFLRRRPDFPSCVLMFELGFGELVWFFFLAVLILPTQIQFSKSARTSPQGSNFWVEAFATGLIFCQECQLSPSSDPMSLWGISNLFNIRSNLPFGILILELTSWQLVCFPKWVPMIPSLDPISSQELQPFPNQMQLSLQEF